MRGVEYLSRLALFHDFAIAQDDHLVGQGTDHFQVMADKQIGQAVALLQIPQQIDDLRLDRDIQGRGVIVPWDKTEFLEKWTSRTRIPLIAVAR